MRRIFNTKAPISAIGMSAYSLFCILVVCGIAHAEEKNLMPATNVMTSVNPFKVSSSSFLQGSPFLQPHQFVYQRPFLNSVPLGVPIAQRSDTVALESSSPSDAVPVQAQVPPVNSSTSSLAANQALPSPIPPAPVLQPPPVQIIQQPPTTGTVFQPGSTFPFLPSQATTFPPSVFPPTTTSGLPSTSLSTSAGSASGTGNLSPWFPSLPAIGCGGTFSLTIIGDVSSSSSSASSSSSSSSSDNSNSHNHQAGSGKRALALQVNSAGGVDLTLESVNGRIFQGEKNIENNQGNNFDIKDVFNNCQVIMFSN
jgi:hypothetical protein